MTLIGAINQGNKKILFADRKWGYSKFKEKRKIFTDSKEKNYLVVSGFILKRLIDEFQENTHKSVECLIWETYKDTNFPGTSFLNYNTEEDSLRAYFVDSAGIESAKIINYLFFGFQVKRLEGFDFRDINHTFLPALRIHQRKYSEIIGNIFDILIFQNKIPIWMNVQLN